MALLSVWTLSVAGIVVIAQLIDIILPEGQTAKYIKSIIATVIVCVLLQPITYLRKIDDTFLQTSTVQTDQIFIDSIYLTQVETLEDKVNQLLKKQFPEITAKVICAREKNLPKINYVIVNVGKSVIDNTDKNIELKEQIISLLCDNLHLQESQIWFN